MVSTTEVTRTSTAAAAAARKKNRFFIHQKTTAIIFPGIISVVAVNWSLRVSSMNAFVIRFFSWIKFNDKHTLQHKYEVSHINTPVLVLILSKYFAIKTLK